MRGRAVPGATHRRLVVLAIFVLVGATWFAQAPRPAAAGFDCDAGMNCARLVFAAPGLGAGTMTAHGISCSVDNGAFSGDCGQVYNFTTDFLVVDITATAAYGSFYIADDGDQFGEGQPVVTHVLLLPDGENSTTKEIRFNLGYQTIELVIKGTGSGRVNHSEEGVYCPPHCTFRYEYGATGIIVIAVADADSTFKSWSGICAGEPAGCQFDMPKSQTLTVTFARKAVATATPKPPTPKPPAQKPTAVPSAPAASASPDPIEPSIAPSLAPVASLPPSAAIASPAQLATPTSSVGPTGPVSSDAGFGSGLVIGLLIAGIVLGVGGFVLWRRRAPAA